jgi:hypothetical protein
VAQVRQTLGTEWFGQAFSAGAGLTQRDAVAIARTSAAPARRRPEAYASRRTASWTTEPGCRPGARSLMRDTGEMIGDRWGVRGSDIARVYPCDAFVAVPTLQAWRGVCIAAPVPAVWPWVAQVRLAPYSYDWIDNLGRRSPRELAGLPEPRAGERFTTAFGRGQGRILSVDVGQQLTGHIGSAFMSYVLLPADQDMTRLLLKIIIRTSRLASLGLSVGDLIMARRQLLNLKQLAERHQQQGTVQG